MSVSLSPLFNGYQSFLTTGLPNNGGFIYTYTAGSTTPQPTYTTNTGAIANANPIPLGADGRPPQEIWLTDGQAYKFVLTDALLNILPSSTFDNLTGFASASTLANLSTANGAVNVGYQPTNATVSRTVSAKFQDKVSVRDFVVAGLGTSISPWTGWDTAITWAGYTSYFFDDGYYSYATSPNFAFNYLSLVGTRGAVIRHTGTGIALSCDAGVSASIVLGVDIKIRLEGNAGSTGGVISRGVVHSNFDIEFHNVPGICFQEYFTVLNTNTLKTTALVVGQTIQPQSLLAINKRNAGENSSANKYYLIAENCSGIGWILNDALNCQFFGGTSENNSGGGIFISATSSYNTFYNSDLEVNSVFDISCSGSSNTFVNCLSTTISTFNGARNVVMGGEYNTVNSGGTGNVFGPMFYSNAAGAFVDTGTATTKRSVYGVTSGTYDNDLVPNVQATVNVGTGGIAIPSAAIIGPLGAFSAGQILAKFNDKSNAGAAHTFFNANGISGNAAVCGLSVAASSVNSRAINAGGTVNASGADYAEYMRKAVGVSDIAKGQIVGITADGLISDKWADSISFAVKSTDPSYVGGDRWAAHLGAEPIEADLEAARQTVDRIAFCGQVPVLCAGVPGDYIVPTQSNAGICGLPVANPTFEQYRIAIGKIIAVVNNIPQIIVKIS